MSSPTSANLCRPKCIYRSVAFRTWNVGEASRIYSRQTATTSASTAPKLSLDSFSSITAAKPLENDTPLRRIKNTDFEERAEVKAKNLLNRSLQNVNSISSQNVMSNSICGISGELSDCQEFPKLTLPKRRHKSVEFGTQNCAVNKMPKSSLVKMGPADCYSSSEYVQYSANYENVKIGDEMSNLQDCSSNMPSNYLSGLMQNSRYKQHVTPNQFVTYATHTENVTDDENEAAEASTSSFKFYSAQQREKCHLRNSTAKRSKYMSPATTDGKTSANGNSLRKSKKYSKFRGTSAENSLSERMTQSSNSQMFPVHRRNKEDEIGTESVKMSRISNNYRSLMNMSGMSAMTPPPKPRFVVDPYAAHFSKSKDTSCIANSTRTKSLDNMTRFGVMSNSYCGQSFTAKDKSAKNSGTLNYAKNLFRKIYSNSTSKFRNSNEKCTISSKEKSGKFDSAISPFFQIRLPEPEELPYLPYNVHYQVEDEDEEEDESDTDTECADKFPTNEDDLKFVEKFNNYSSPDEGVHLSCSASSSNSTNSSTLNPAHSNNSQFNSQKIKDQISTLDNCPGEYALRSTANGTLIRERRKPSEKYSNPQTSGGKTKPVVCGKRNDNCYSSPLPYKPIVTNQIATELEIETSLPQENFISLNLNDSDNCANNNNKKECFSEKANLNESLLLCESYLNECASPQDSSSSLGYSTMSSSGYTIGNDFTPSNDNDYGSIEACSYGIPSNSVMSTTTLTPSKCGSRLTAAEQKNSRSSSAGPRTILQTKQQQPNYNDNKTISRQHNNIKVGSLNNLNGDDNLQNAEKKFANWNELFQFLKNEISEMRSRDTQIWNNLTHIEREISNVVPQSGPAR